MNGAPIIVIRNSKATSTGSGTPGTAISAASTIRARSQASITARRGSRSAKPDSRIPPMKLGTKLTAKVSAASTAEPVRA